MAPGWATRRSSPRSTSDRSSYRPIRAGRSHLVDGAGNLRAQSDSVPVVGGLPTLRWAPGRAVRDTRGLRLPPDLAAGDYQLQAGLYVMATGAHLPVLDDRLAREGQSEHVVLTDLRIRP